MKLFKSLTTISSMVIFSRILGLTRDILIVKVFGVNQATDAFLVAFKLPNLLRKIFSEGGFSQAIVPILTEYKSKWEEHKIRIFISNITGLLILFLLGITIVGICQAPFIIKITSTGFMNNPEKFLLTSTLLRITFPYLLFISLTSLSGAILNTWNNFLVPALTPILLNISMISFILFTTKMFNPPIIALAWSVILGGILQLGYQLIYLKKINMLVLPNLKFNDINVWRVLKFTGPAVFSISINQISIIMNNLFSSFLDFGSISWIYYADRLIEFPLGIFGVSLGTVLLNSLSKCINNKNYKQYSIILDWGLKLCFLLGVPCSMVLNILAEPIIISLFKYGKFTTRDVVMTTSTLISYSLGLIGLMLVKVLTSAFYSCKDINNPVKISICTLIINQVMNLFLVHWLKHVGLSISISISANIHAILLYLKFRQKKWIKYQKNWLLFIIKIILSSGVMTLTLLGILKITAINWYEISVPYRFLFLFSLLSISTVIYLTFLNMVGFRWKKFLENPYVDVD